ncbi:hypothetical protein DSC45_34745 [Streptomyces sp. YIM 130001]|uniref:hypothetical protein n=1 Tax=Streptomyces sp. YIM 130001 TaxID=2259644 RepID=UPI000EDA1C5E|nr:hypothetical protein [Streptomyces sp. YIM 130001]RII06989.1 hypothetical protein DSC45_34745 [Streptomyces sp. YIM 130001]
MSSRGTLVKVAVPMVAAAAVGAVVLVTASADGPSRGAEQRQSVAGSGGVAKAHMGDPDDPATWRLPIEAYVPSKANTRLIAGARDTLIDACMEKAGFAEWAPALDLPDLGGKTLTDWRYGVHDAGQVAKRGYHPDAAEQEAYDAAMEAGAVDESGADEGQLKNCVAQTDGEVPAIAEDDLAQQISGNAYAASMQEPAVVSVFEKWATCMGDKGFSYKKPMEASDDPRFNDPSRVTDLEIATAKADVECRDRHDVEKTWYDAEVPLQQAAIKKHQSELDVLKKDNKAAVAKASAARAPR